MAISTVPPDSARPVLDPEEHLDLLLRDLGTRRDGLSGLEAALVTGGFLWVLHRGGWSPGDATGKGTALHHTWLLATTMTFGGITACQAIYRPRRWVVRRRGRA